VQANSDGFRLIDSFRASRGKLVLTYALSMLESVFSLLYPWAAGYAIDGLIKGNIGAMGPVIGFWLAHTVVGAFRQMFDTRVFTAIYTRMATSAAERLHRLGATQSQIAARLHMGREIISFYETYIPALITVTTSFFGALVMLAIYDWQFGLYAAAIIVPAAIANRFFLIRAMKLNHSLNDQMEREVDIVSQPDLDRINVHYRALAALKIRLSDNEARTWSFVELLFIGLTAAVLLRATLWLGMGAGVIFASITYVLDFTASLRQAPFVLDKVIRLIDIQRRLEKDGAPTGSS
jgi:ABC-type multidrug transport system fused ATPase/permease subunit